MFKSPNRNKLECSPFQINSAIHESTLDFLLALYNYSNNTQICCYVMSLCKKKLLHTDFSKHLYLFDLKLQSTYFMCAFSRVMLNLDTCKSIHPWINVKLLEKYKTKWSDNIATNSHLATRIGVKPLICTHLLVGLAMLK